MNPQNPQDAPSTKPGYNGTNPLKTDSDSEKNVAGGVDTGKDGTDDNADSDDDTDGVSGAAENAQKTDSKS